MVRLLISLVCGCIASCVWADDGPNIVHIVADDLGVMDVGFMGDERYHTPNIDRLASQSMIFTEGYAPAANCAPSRASVMTGQQPTRHGVYTVQSSERGRLATRKIVPTQNRFYLDDREVLITELFKSRGYVTAQVGKWHLGDNPLSQGVDINVAGTHRGGPGNKAGYFSPYDNPYLSDGPDGEFLTDRLTTEAIKILEAHKDEKFFLYFPFFAVHTPIQGKPELVEKYRGRDDVNPEYAALVESLDENVGRLLDALDRLGLSENTIVVFTSDNGGIRKFSPQDPYRAGKGSYYEGGVRVPFTVRWPGVVAPGMNDIPVTGLDFYPTYLEILGMDASKPLDGDSLLGLLKGEGSLEERPLVWHFPIYLQAYDPATDDGRDPLFRTRPGSTMRYGQWKLHHYFEDMTYELYDLESDIGERNDLAGEMPEKLAELAGILELWRRAHNAPIPTTPNPYYEASVDTWTP